jgi:RNA polymerase sigma factor (TIGR02999 family)
MDSDASGGVTRLLLDWGGGDEQARERMLPLVYQELRRIAAAYMRGERAEHTLQPTALVHEAYLRLVDQRRVDWHNRAQFVGVAAMMMRRILANHARNRAAAKRESAEAVTMMLPAGEPDSAVDVLAVHEALDRLTALDPRKGRIVELKFFGGLKTSEIAGVLDVSTATVERDWSFARAWLYDAIGTPGERRPIVIQP